MLAPLNYVILLLGTQSNLTRWNRRSPLVYEDHAQMVPVSLLQFYCSVKLTTPMEDFFFQTLEWKFVIVLIELVSVVDGEMKCETLIYPGTFTYPNKNRVERKRLCNYFQIRI